MLKADPSFSTMTSRSTSVMLPDSGWSQRHGTISLRQTMNLEPHSAKRDTFVSTSPAYPPTDKSRTYGGHVFAQSAWAAAHTCPHGMHIHSITGYFAMIGNCRYAFQYKVRRVRTGGVYALRAVDAYQDLNDGKGEVLIFACIVGLKRDEQGKHMLGANGRREDYEHQDVGAEYINEEYASCLFVEDAGRRRKRRMDEFPLCQPMDGLWNDAIDVREWERRAAAFPGLEMRKVIMDKYNPTATKGGRLDAGMAARHWKLLILYKIILDAKSDNATDKPSKTAADDDLNLHAAGHLYASDRNSLFLAQRALGFEKIHTSGMGSLSHTVNFHGHAEVMRMVDATGKPKVFVQESWISNSGADRVSHNSRIVDQESGRVIATTVQDGMMRMPYNAPYTVVDGDTIVRRKAHL